MSGQTKETIRRNFTIRTDAASAAHFQATQKAKVELEAAIGAARMKFNTAVDAAARSYDEEMKAAIDERCTAMREVLSLQVPEPV